LLGQTLASDEAVPVLRGKASPLEFLQAVYCHEMLPLSVRMKAAIGHCRMCIQS